MPLSAVQRLMFQEIQKEVPDLTEGDFAALQPEDIQHYIGKSPEKWLDEHMGTAPPASTGEQIKSGLASGFKQGASIAKALPGVAAHAMFQPEKLAGDFGRPAAAMGKSVANDLAGTFLQPTPSDIKQSNNGFLLSKVGDPSLMGKMPMTQGEDEFRNAALKTAGQVAMATGNPEAMLAGGAAQTPNEPYRGGASVLPFMALPAALRLGEKTGNAIAGMTPKGQAQEMGRVAQETQAGGPNRGRATLGFANRFDKGDQIRGVNISPENAALGDFTLANNPAKRAQAEAALGKQAVGSTERMAHDLSKDVGGRYNTGERVKELTQERSAFGQSPEGYGGMKPKPTYEAAAHADIEPFFSQPVTQQALQSAERTGLIGTTVDPVAVAREQFQQEVAQAQHAQGLWDSQAAQLGASGKQMPGELYGGAKSPASQALISKTLGPRPEVPTAPPVPSPEMMHHVLKRLDKAVADGFQAGGAQADVAARLKPVADHLRQFLHDHVEGFTQANQGWAERSGLIEAHQKLPTSPEGVLSAEDAWKLKDTDALEKQMAALSRKPIPKPGTIVDFGSKSQLNEFQDAMASHLRTAIENGDLKPEQLTMDALRGDKALYDKVRAAFERPSDFRNFTARAKIEAMSKNYQAPTANVKPPIATQSWFSKYLPAKLIYKAGGQRYLKAISNNLYPELFTPGHAPEFPPRPTVGPVTDAEQRMAALAAMLSAQRGDSTP